MLTRSCEFSVKFYIIVNIIAVTKNKYKYFKLFKLK